MNTIDPTTTISKKQRFKEEMIKYALISVYLYVCFSVLILYKAAILKGQGIDWLPYGVAVIQALVLGKVILIGDVLSIGNLEQKNPLLHRIAWKTLAMVTFLFVFKVTEELVVGLYHGESMSEIWAALTAHSGIEIIAPIAMMSLVLVPLITATETSRMLGSRRLRDYLLKRAQE